MMSKTSSLPPSFFFFFYSSSPLKLLIVFFFFPCKFFFPLCYIFSLFPALITPIIGPNNPWQHWCKGEVKGSLLSHSHMIWLDTVEVLDFILFFILSSLEAMLLLTKIPFYLWSNIFYKVHLIRTKTSAGNLSSMSSYKKDPTCW